MNNRTLSLLVVDDDDDFRSTMIARFDRQGYQVEGAAGGEEALSLAQRREHDVAIFDMMMPGMSGLELLEAFQKAHPECEVIMLTGQGSIESAVQAMKMGAFDFVTKPFPLKDLEGIIDRAYERRKLKKENQQLKVLVERGQSNKEMIGEAATIQEVFRLIERAGPSEKAILIQGESGTGKELVAQALHRCSGRSRKPLVVVNCAALPEPLLESELFGHEKGAFTGAVSAKPGLFEVADGGTLFIDEIGEMPVSLQAKLLRVLENGSLRRVGSVKERKVDVRILAATNRNLAQEVSAGAFREDLYYRINVMSLELPPLRRRKTDIPLLVAHFLGGEWEVSPEALEVIERYNWPGNIRQLINVIERGKILAENGLIELRDLPRELIDNDPDGLGKLDTDDLSIIERSKVVEVLRRESGNKTRAAHSLGIERRKIYRLIEKYAITDAEIS